MLKASLIFSAILFGSFVQSEYCGAVGKSADPIIEPGVDQSQIAEQVLSISELNSNNPKKGVFETRGFVAKIYTCPPCPPDAQCKPCMADNTVISEEMKNLETYLLSEKEMIIFSAKATDFERNKEYKFKFEISDKKTTAATLNDAHLIRADLIKD